MIRLEQVTKPYEATTAVDGLSVEFAAGLVTAFLGPNRTGESTPMRVLLELDHPTWGRALVQGRPYRAHRQPLRLWAVPYSLASTASIAALSAASWVTYSSKVWRFANDLWSVRHSVIAPLRAPAMSRYCFHGVCAFAACA